MGAGMATRLREAKRPVSLLAGPYGHPLHPVLVTVPRPGGRRRATVGRPAEQHFPVAVVVLHGLLAATTLVLVLLAALGAGS
jgi:hypothetical protein